ncbi:MAG TPA: hypothetical protein VGI81_09125, partial [Tepidisphaeraceae bacterium]
MGSIGNNAEAEPQAFAARCAESGLLVWRCMADGSVLLAPRLPAAIYSLAASSCLGALIAEKFATGGDGQSRDLELYPGCWIACALDPSTPGGTFWVMLIPTEAGLTSPTFEAICQSAGLSVASAAEALRPFVKYTPAQKDQAVAAFIHFHESQAVRREDEAMISQFTWKLSQAYEELSLFFRLASSLNTNADPVETIQGVCDELQQILPFGWVAASFVRGAARVPGLDGRTISAGLLPCMPGMLAQAVKGACQAESHEQWVKIHNPPKTALANLAGGQVIAEPVSYGSEPIG